MNPKFNVGDRIKIKDKYNDTVEGHITLILNPFNDDRIYYCSMYPGALGNYQYVSVVDLNCCAISDGKIQTLQALNTFNESELELVSNEYEDKI